MKATQDTPMPKPDAAGLAERALVDVLIAVVKAMPKGPHRDEASRALRVFTERTLFPDILRAKEQGDG